MPTFQPNTAGADAVTHGSSKPDKNLTVPADAATPTWLQAWMTQGFGDGGEVPLEEVPTPASTDHAQIFAGLPLSSFLLTLSTSSELTGGEVAGTESKSDDAELPDEEELPASGPIPLSSYPSFIDVVTVPVQTPVPTLAALPSLQAVQAPENGGAVAEVPTPVVPATLGGALPVKPSPLDKGELVWMADLRIEEGPSLDPTGPNPKPTRSDTLPQATEKGASELPIPAVSKPAQMLDADSRSNSDSNSPDRRTESGAPNPSPKRTTADELAPQSAAAPMPADSRISPAPPHGFSGADSAQAAPESKDVGPAVNVETERARPLRPQQIASIQIDVQDPNRPAGDDSPIRLQISQRGDQVNVRVRSWDQGVGAISEARMQPLLDSLAQKGFVSHSSPMDRWKEMGNEGGLEFRPAKPVESSHDARFSSADQQATPFSDERQKQQQERQQQQQQQASARKNQQPASFALDFSPANIAITNDNSRST